MSDIAELLTFSADTLAEHIVEIVVQMFWLIAFYNNAFVGTLYCIDFRTCRGGDGRLGSWQGRSAL
jgi:hypothetical protein